MGNLVSILFFVSRSTGLVYEVVWAKYLALVLGNMAHIHTVVLATFLGGLALGMYFWDLGPIGFESGCGSTARRVDQGQRN